MFAEKTMVGSDAFPIEMVRFFGGGGRLLVFREVHASFVFKATHGTKRYPIPQGTFEPIKI